MGLVATDNYVAAWVDTLGPQMMAALQNARTRVEDGSGDGAVARWFGFNPTPEIRKAMGQYIGKLRSTINLKQLPVGFVSLTVRNRNQNARAWNIAAPQLDLGTGFAPPGPGGISTVELDVAFNRLPNYLPTLVNGTIDAGGWNQSKFETLIHEVTHVVIGTRDVPLLNGQTAYGAQHAATLATEDPNKALNNAENWAIFIEACGRNSSS